MANMLGEQANQRMVDRLIAAGTIWSRPLIDAFRATPRHLFLDRVFHYSRSRGRWVEIATRRPGPAALRLLYADRALTTRLNDPAPGQTSSAISSSSQPSLMSVILEDMRLTRGLRILELGTGTGYNAALLAHVVGPVTSLEVDRRVLAEARDHLSRFPERQVELVHGDGRNGYAAAAPYDRILATAATPDVEPAWIEQADDGGCVMAPLSLAPGLAFMVRGDCREGRFVGRLRRPAYFMPLRAEEGPDSTDPTTRIVSLPEAGTLTAVAAPWDDRNRPRPLLNGGGVPQALAFLAWLEGLTIVYQMGPDNRPAYGIADMVRGHACWLGRRSWHVTGNVGHELGRRLWRTFLDAGGLWPGDFRLHAWPLGQYGAEPSGPLTFRREGPSCVQVWEWTGPRRRE
jgi:protein-L-isoaspartate(D-aspartate) O-methyltransferase